MSSKSYFNGRGENRVTATEKKSEINDKKIKILTGNHAAAHALRQARVGVIAAYPITPQSPVVEKIAEFVSKGKINTLFAKVESEHSAMAV